MYIYFMHPSLYYTKTKANKLRCQLCPHYCIIPENERGTCNVRRNSGGELISENYGQITGLAVDPVEKKPLYHFFPGTGILSIGSFGCNMSCSFCQNSHISQATADNSVSLKAYSCGEIIEAAEAMNQSMIAYTYNEPVVFYEFMLDCVRLAHSKGIQGVMVSNGFINEKPLDELMQYMDAFNIDLKAFDRDFYKGIAGAALDPVLKTIKKIAASDKHLEITCLVIPGLNDNEGNFREMISWIAKECGEDQVLHLSRYFPHYKLRESSTPLSTIEKFIEIARGKLNYVYPGNTATNFDSNTYCHNCNKLLIERSMYTVNITFKNGKCPRCDTDIPGKFTS